MATTRILVGYDGGPAARDALALAVALAEATDARLVLGVVLPQVSALSSAAARQEAAGGGSAAAFATASSQLEAIDTRIVPERRAIAAEPAADGLRDLARSEDADLIVLGASHRGPLGRIVVGSTADRLLAGADRSVAVAPRGYADREAPVIRLVGLAYDGSVEARAAATVARGIALRACAPLRAFGVCAPPSSVAGDDDRETALERELHELVGSLPAEVGGQVIALAGDPVDALLAQGRHAADIVVFGSHGAGKLMRLLGASVSSEVIRGAPWPVLVVAPHRPLPFALPDYDDPGERRAGQRATAPSA
ncbi:MAG TPA: universal stress protein [Solirubrobacterales bacterium]|nr:universal stress protein [Solirubrobacterales bacterium]